LIDVHHRELRMSIGILLSEMPRMMQDVVANLLEGTPDVHVVAQDVPVGTLLTRVERERPELVMLWTDADECSPICAELLARFPQLAVVALEDGGQRATIYTKRPRRVRREEISRHQLLAAIRRAARRRRPSRADDAPSNGASRN
jgi:DNA-binding NarL/FixJ family response regulator